MQYKMFENNPNSKKKFIMKSLPVLTARGFDDIRFRAIFLSGEWLKKGPRREVEIFTPANNYLWVMRGRLHWDRELEEFVWLDYDKLRQYTVNLKGELKRMIP